MSEPSTSTSKSKTHFSIRLISNITQLSTLTFSRPLYLSYLIFFSPYLLKLISFLYPLFLTTFLLSLASLLFLVHDRDGGGGGGGYLLTTYTTLIERWRRIGKENQGSIGQEEETHDHQCSESLQIYEILFGSSSSSSSSSSGGDEERKSEAAEQADVEKKLDSPSAVVCNQELGKDRSSSEAVEEKRMEKFLRILDEFEKMSAASTNNNARTEKSTTATTGPAKNGSQAKGNNKKVHVPINGENPGTPLVKSRSQRLSSNTGDYQSTHGSSRDLGSYGSMRKEKEWKRTLACKLFEERHNVDGGEGMDSLWEAYEMDSNKLKNRNSDEKTKNKKKETANKNKTKNKIEKEVCDDEEGLDEEIGSGQLCCLQALKLSAGKMSMGMGRPNLVKITKAIKGFGWLHSGSSKHSKKVHNSTGDHHHKDRY